MNPNPVREGLTTFATFVPRLIGALLILVIGYLVATALAKIVDKLLERAGFDRAVERGGIAKALAHSPYDASDIVAKLVFFAIFIPVLSMAVGALGIVALQQPLAAFIALIPNIIVAVVLVVLGAVVAGAVKSVIQNTLGGLSYGKLVAEGAAVLVLFGFLKSALDQVGVATSVTGPVLYAFLAAVVGVVVVGVGGGLIKPMQRRWDGWLDRAADEQQKISQQAKATSAAPSAPPSAPGAAAPGAAAPGAAGPGGSAAAVYPQEPVRATYPADPVGGGAPAPSEAPTAAFPIGTAPTGTDPTGTYAGSEQTTTSFPERPYR